MWTCRETNCWAAEVEECTVDVEIQKAQQEEEDHWASNLPPLMRCRSLWKNCLHVISSFCVCHIPCELLTSRTCVHSKAYCTYSTWCFSNVHVRTFKSPIHFRELGHLLYCSPSLNQTTKLPDKDSKGNQHNCSHASGDLQQEHVRQSESGDLMAHVWGLYCWDGGMSYLARIQDCIAQ